jgi:signal transduction histidine kinase
MAMRDSNAVNASVPPTAGWLMPDTLVENLQLIADGVVAVAGFAVAAIRIRRGDELELVVDTGLPEEVGTRIPLNLMLDELELADDWGVLLFVPHERGSIGPGAGWIVPDVAISTAPDAWHPLDMLVAPLYDDQGELRGTLAIDEPADGRRPGPDRRRVLERFAALASRAVLSAVERDAFAEQVAMANTVKEVVRTTSAQLSLDGLLAASERTLVEGFRADGLWIQTVIEDDRADRMYTSEDVNLVLPPGIVEFAAHSASYCWHHQLVVTIGDGLPVPPMMDPHQFHQITELLHGISMSSLVFVPLGAGPEHMGSLVLTRRDAGQEWSGIERSALLDIGHDLGRATLNARTFEREHALVAELQALDTYKSQLIATVSHELKSPLTTVAGHLEMLESDTVGVGDQARPSLAAIGRASRRMSRVIEDLLLLRKIGEAEMPLGQEDVDLVELVHEAVAMTTLLALSKHLDLDVSVPKHPVLALGEREELDKVVLNVISNAVKYTPEGRGVRISLETRPDSVVLRVADEGLGISEEDQGQLFTEFFRSNNSRAVAEPGTGLGLAIVKRIVERHRGAVEVESTLGQGSTFTIILPTANGPGTSPETPPPRRVRSARPPLARGDGVSRLTR